MWATNCLHKTLDFLNIFRKKIACRITIRWGTCVNHFLLNIQGFFALLSNSSVCNNSLDSCNARFLAMMEVGVGIITSCNMVPIRIFHGGLKHCNAFKIKPQRPSNVFDVESEGKVWKYGRKLILL